MTRILKRKLLIVGAFGVGLCVLFFIATCILIGHDVKNHCWEARKKYVGDCTEALIALLNDEGRSLRERNSAVWALGQLGDSRALPVLQGYYTGNIPSKESLDKTISQYELKKAIKLTSGGFNAMAACTFPIRIIYDTIKAYE